MRYSNTEKFIEPHDGGEIYVGEKTRGCDENGTCRPPRVEVEVSDDTEAGTCGYRDTMVLSLTKNETKRLIQILEGVVGGMK